MPDSLHIPVSEEGHVGSARRAVQSWAERAGWSEEFVGKTALVITELARNLVLHTTKGGRLVIRRFTDATGDGVSILSLDQGPGVENFSLCMRDGYSTAGTSGIGLGGVQRIAQRFEMHSQPQVGTALLAQLDQRSLASPVPSENGLLGVVAVPIKGEKVSGDSWAAQHGPGWSRFMIADGLGHGPIAAEASLAAVKCFNEGSNLDLRALLQMMHATLRSTRGAAVTIVHIDHSTREVRCAGIGNISSAIFSGEDVINLVPQNGTVGAAIPSQIREFSQSWAAGSLLIMHSDGIKTNWQVSRYAGLSARHPDLISGVLFRDFVRGSDDATILTVRL